MRKMIVIIFAMIFLLGGYIIYTYNSRNEIPHDVLKLFEEISPMNKNLSGYPKFFDKSLKEQGYSTMINIATYINRDKKTSLSEDKISKLKDSDLGIVYCGADFDTCVKNDVFLDKSIILDSIQKIFNVEKSKLDDVFKNEEIGFCGGFNYDKEYDILYEFTSCGGGPYEYYEKIYKYDINKDYINIYVYATYTKYIDNEFYLLNKIDDKKYKYDENFKIDKSNEKDFYRLKYSFKKNDNDYYIYDIVNIDR